MKANKKVSEITAWNKIHWKEIIIQTTVENSMMSWLKPRSSSCKIMQGTLFSDVWFLLKGDNSDSSKSISLTLRTSYNFWKSYKVCIYRNPLRSSSDNIYGCVIKLWIQATYFQRLVFNLGKYRNEVNINFLKEQCNHQSNGMRQIRRPGTAYNCFVNVPWLLQYLQHTKETVSVRLANRICFFSTLITVHIFK